jgi:small-conductance mechanosensitive channel
MPAKITYLVVPGGGDAAVAQRNARSLFGVLSGSVVLLAAARARAGNFDVEAHVPAELARRVLGLALFQWLGILLAVAVAFLVGRSATWLLIRALTPLTKRTRAAWDDELLDALRRPVRFFFGVVAFRPIVEPLGLPESTTHVLARVVGTITIGALAWAAICVASVLSNSLERRAKARASKAADAELRARAVATQVRVLRRVVNVAITIIAGALVLLQFEVVRSVGVSLLASAGLAGIVLGFAAQRTIGNLFAGIQLSITQPIRIGDAVVVDGQWGHIEEVTLTYVVVRIWDERRLLVPMSRFLEQPFENWTKVSPELHGTVFLHVEFTLPIDELRAELDRILADHPSWDRRTKSVHVTDVKERSLEIRVLVSAANAADLWALRTDVRERLVRWLVQLEGGRYLPNTRVTVRERMDEGR